jgi:hypothetical protein
LRFPNGHEKTLSKLREKVVSLFVRNKIGMPPNGTMVTDILVIIIEVLAKT